MIIVLQNVREAQIIFSDDGNMLGLFSVDFTGASKLRIFKINGDQSMQDLFDQIENNEFSCQFANLDFSEIENFIFEELVISDVSHHNKRDCGPK